MPDHTISPAAGPTPALHAPPAGSPEPAAAPPPLSKRERQEAIERLLELEPERLLAFLMDAIRAAHEGPRLLSKTALAERLDVSSRTIERMDAKGLIPAPEIRRGQFVRWQADAIARWIAAGCPARAKWDEMERLRLAGRRRHFSTP